VKFCGTDAGRILASQPRRRLRLPLYCLAGASVLAAGFCMDAADYADLGEGTVAGARKAGLWDRLGPITRVVFERFPEVRRCVASPMAH
jgi:hypothetical protein